MLCFRTITFHFLRTVTSGLFKLLKKFHFNWNCCYLFKRCVKRHFFLCHNIYLAIILPAYIGLFNERLSTFWLLTDFDIKSKFSKSYKFQNKINRFAHWPARYYSIESSKCWIIVNLIIIVTIKFINSFLTIYIVKFQSNWTKCWRTPD